MGLQRPGKRLGAEHLLGAELDYCAPRGIPHSVFRGWDPLDQAKALAWQRRQQETHSCGVHPEVWDPELGGDPDGLRLVSKLCRACEISEQGRDQFTKNRLAGEYQVWAFGPEPPAP